MKKFFKIIGIVFLVILFLGFLGSLFDDKQSTTKSINGAETTENAAPVATSKPKIEILSTNDKADQFMSSVYIEVRNNSNKTAAYADFKSYYLDANGAVIASGLGNLSDFGPGETL